MGPCERKLDVDGTTWGPRLRKMVSFSVYKDHLVGEREVGVVLKCRFSGPTLRASDSMGL